ncbi:arginine N-succinyltransferase [Marinobacter sp. SS21]|uniref:arginine N-succinyltransferase n=1 Tax=Marinobacter sp. SS21 TaxID=2979460 RepID=UPI0023314653|nr:arginine N-succinyltransferase [Marinobacter sp. SS21]MDC0662489.1 arginine N-succinyltransferase [Marinobacter sp. SS21]
MWLVRPAQLSDLEGIRTLVSDLTGQLSTTLPETEEGLAEKIGLSARSFSGELGPEAGQRFLFVLEHRERGGIAGVAGIDGRAGNGQPFYNYRRDALIHASHELGVSRRVEVLYSSHALTDRTLLGAFAIAPELRGTEAFELLSRARLLFIAGHRNWFTDDMVVEIQGVSCATGEVPFWDSLGRHFFNMDFETADRYSGMLSKTFIAELMPPNPIYVTLLTDAAQRALGQPHPATLDTIELFKQEGFHAGSYVDIFDGGPVLEARTDHLKTLVTSHCKKLHSGEPTASETCLLASGERAAFRCTVAAISETLDDAVKASLEVLKVLACSSGDDIRVAPL